MNVRRGREEKELCVYHDGTFHSFSSLVEAENNPPPITACHTPTPPSHPMNAKAYTLIPRIWEYIAWLERIKVADGIKVVVSCSWDEETLAVILNYYCRGYNVIIEFFRVEKEDKTEPERWKCD